MMLIWLDLEFFYLVYNNDLLVEQHETLRYGEWSPSKGPQVDGERTKARGDLRPRQYG